MNQQSNQQLPPPTSSSSSETFAFGSYLKRVWTGTCSKGEYLLDYGVVFCIYLMGIIVAAAVYPGDFSLTGVYTSYLGGYPNNPDGYRFYIAHVS